ncbi:winged helix-turn-helix domain-containing protein [Occultella aeris]|uniref:Response regulator MprA n=1 Tax=Occultella aeris TaxID=2761496 RepID=A0A7M4DJF6_9MICO|nr:winged helix-turn-helix domain-containing protein [Occultella aeris]VZO37170.1 Response regulator MprA [Occultella aeris]
MTTTARRPAQAWRDDDGAREWSRAGHGAGTVVFVDTDRGAVAALGPHLASLDIALRNYSDPLRALARLGADDADVVVVAVRTGTPPLGRFVEIVRSELTIPVLIAFGPGDLDTVGPAVLAGARPAVDLPYRSTGLLRALHDVWPTRQIRAAIRVGNLLMDPESRDVILAGQGVNLSTLEFAVLFELCRNADHVVTRPVLAREIWPESPDPDNTLIATVVRLRRKLQAHGAGLAVHTVRGLGYRLDSAQLQDIVGEPMRLVR